MSKSKPNGNVEDADLHVKDNIADAADVIHENHDDEDHVPEDRNDAMATAATVVVVGVGAVLFEAALLPGLVLGVAAALAPKYLPRMGAALNPLFRSTVRGAYKLGRKSREAFAEAQEHMHDIAAEVHAEGEAKTTAAASEIKGAHSVM